MIRLGSASACRIFGSSHTQDLRDDLHQEWRVIQHILIRPVSPRPPYNFHCTNDKNETKKPVSFLIYTASSSAQRARIESLNSQRHPKMSVGNTIQYLNLTPNAVCTHASVTKRIMKVTQTQPAGVYPYGEKLR